MILLRNKAFHNDVVHKQLVILIPLQNKDFKIESITHGKVGAHKQHQCFLNFHTNTMENNMTRIL